MPKIIKKKLEKTKPQDIQSMLERARKTAEARKKTLIAMAAALVLVLAVAGGFYYNTVVKKANAEEASYEGYRIFYGAQGLSNSVRYEKALEHFQRSNKLKSSPYALYYIANSYYALGKNKEAESALKELNTRFPGDEHFTPLALHKLALITLQEDRFEEALKHLEGIYKFKTGSFKDMALLTAGTILEQLGRKQEALEKYNIIVQEMPGSPFEELARVKLSLEEEAATSGKTKDDEAANDKTADGERVKARREKAFKDLKAIGDKPPEGAQTIEVK